eukprot:1150991-Pelagomonas_calceolata.AAC.1
MVGCSYWILQMLNICNDIPFQSVGEIHRPEGLSEALASLLGCGSLAPKEVVTIVGGTGFSSLGFLSLLQMASLLWERKENEEIVSPVQVWLRAEKMSVQAAKEQNYAGSKNTAYEGGQT